MLLVGVLLVFTPDAEEFQKQGKESEEARVR